MRSRVLAVLFCATASLSVVARASDDPLARLYTRYFSSTHDSSEFASVLDEVRTQVQNDPEAVALVKATHLTESEQAALFIYCEDDEARINRALRGDKKAGFKQSQIQPLIDDIDSALSKLPPYASAEPVYRGTDFDQETADLHQVGATVLYKAYTSSSIGEKTRNGPAYPYQFKIISRTGRRIKYFSEHSEENEVLFPRGAKFKVTGRTDALDGKINITMEETN